MNDVRLNAGYIITNSIPVGSAEFVLGIHQTLPDKFVTWQRRNKEDYFWGHYTDDLLKATKDLCERALKEVQALEERARQASSRNPHSGQKKQKVIQAQKIRKDKDRER